MEIERIREQMRRAFEGEAWCGSALKEALAGVTAEQAAKRPIAEAHNIWEIVLHLAAWKNTICRRFAGEPLKEPIEGDFPPVAEISEPAWRNALEKLEENHRKLQNVVAGLNDSRLDEPVFEGSTSFVYETLHGMIQHDLYHAAQIAILRKTAK